MLIIVNGVTRETSAQTLAEFLAQSEFCLELIAVECDEKIVKKQEWASCKLSEGKRFEVVEFVAGG